MPTPSKTASAVEAVNLHSSRKATRGSANLEARERSTFQDYRNDPASFRDYFKRRAEVEHNVGWKSSAIYNGVRAGTFPAPVRLGNNSVAWLASEVYGWMADRLAEREDRQKDTESNSQKSEGVRA